MPRHHASVGRAVHAVAAAEDLQPPHRPNEFADVTSNAYYDWFIHHAYILYGAFAIADKFAATFKEFPPVQRPNSFTIDDALRMMADTSGGAGH